MGQEMAASSGLLGLEILAQWVAGGRGRGEGRGLTPGGRGHGQTLTSWNWAHGCTSSAEALVHLSPLRAEGSQGGSEALFSFALGSLGLPAVLGG